MNPMWLSQIWAVMRLELKKSFFNRRSFWIYLLAAAPIVIYAAHSLEVMRDSDRRARSAQPGVTREKMSRIQPEMTRDEVVAILGEPAVQRKFQRRNRRTEWLTYSDGRNELYLRIGPDGVENINMRGSCNLAEDTIIFAGVYQFFFLRLMLFFGCVFVFINLFRGELLDKSLHYYFLAPVRREVVVAGKYLAGVMATVIIFGTSVALQILVMNMHFTPQVLEDYLVRGNGWNHAFSYVGVTALACIGYGTVFLTAGILLRNPLIPAVSILLWESINGILPATLRKISVIYYLRSLSPVEIPLDRGVPPPVAMLALNVDPVAPWIAILGVLGVSAALLYLAARSVRKLEINYGTE
jgi:hypothetical protein